MKRFAEIIEKDGINRAVDGKNVLPLDDSESLWMVRTGRVDVFAVPFGDGNRRGARVHLCRARPGQILCGCDSSSPDLPRLIAVGLPGSEVVALGPSRRAEFLSDAAAAGEFVDALETWIEDLTAAISQRRLPANAALLEPGDEAGYRGGVTAGPAHGVAWIVDADAETQFLGRLHMPAASTNGAFPVSASGWIETDGPTQLKTATTAALLRESRLWTGLQSFHEVILTAAAENRKQSVAAERKRLDDKRRMERQQSEAALFQLAAAASPKADDGLSSDADPLLSACRLVGERTGITIAKPQKSGEQSSGDPVDVIARASAVRVRRVVLSEGWWRDDNGPLLAFLKEGGRPVALLSRSPSRYEIVDPVTGTRTAVDRETSATLQTFGYTFYRSFAPKRLTAKDVFKFGLHGTRRDWLFLVAMGIAAGLLGLLIPAATGWVIGTVIPGAERSQLLLVVLALTVASAVAVLFEFVQGVAMMRIETRMDSSVEAAVWDRLLNLPASFFRKYTAGDLAMRVMGVSYIRQAFTQSATSSLLTFLASFVYFALLFYYDVGLAILATAVFFVIVGVTCVAAWIQLPLERSRQRDRGKVWGILLQLFTGISRLRVAGAENRALAYWARHYSRQTKTSIRSQMVSNNLESFLAALPVAAPLVIFASVALFPSEKLSVAGFLAFNVAFIEIIGAAVSMSGTLSAVIDVVPLFERAQPILATVPEFDRGKRDPGDLTGEIEINHASFRYDRDAPLVLDDVSLHIRPGEFVAFVGPSGAGKSTILRLLLGFETATTGSIYYDREDLAGLDQLAVRRQIGVVLQDSKPMPGDLLSNIIGSAPLTQDDAWEAARLSGLDKDIEQMPMGMYTFLSDGESTLSGGQRQRLLIARAMVKKPKIVFFDEATSALDNVTQAKVSQSLENLKATRVVVAHRLSTVINADRIFVIDRGKVVQRGNYEELSKQPGLFADLVKRQVL
ncbi:MAG: NHLP bacteriocin export ABC transporter permease/ATPase subunit [Planctomycetaceae bacterium]